MYEEEFALRLSKLRTEKGVSARDMSLSIGQNPGYINNIESGKSLPSMTAFFYICDYLNISPKDFFDSSIQQPEAFTEITENIKKLNDKELNALAIIIEKLAN